jgi:hypothetical protein
MITKLTETTLAIFLIALACTIACLPTPEGTTINATNSSSDPDTAEEWRKRMIEKGLLQ